MDRYKATCFTRDGRPKSTYNTLEKAQKFAEKLPNPVNIYNCIFHKGWHLGRKSNES